MQQYKKKLAVVASSLVFGLTSLHVQAVSVQVLEVVPWENAKNIASNIKKECQIQAQLSEFVASYSKKKGIEIERVTDIDTAAGKKVLEIKITDAISKGGAFAFTGHKKSTTISGTLFENGNKVASFEGRRMSGGGMFGGYKGSCSVLGRTVKALGKDVAVWLADPKDGASIGDL